MEFKQAIKDGFVDKMEGYAQDIAECKKHRDEWVTLVEAGIFPDVPEATELRFSTEMWPMYIHIPLNKVLIGEVVARFEALGWKTHPWDVQSYQVSVRMDIPEGLTTAFVYVSLIAQGIGANCKIVKIGTKTYDQAICELVCEDGAKEEVF